MPLFQLLLHDNFHCRIIAFEILAIQLMQLFPALQLFQISIILEDGPIQVAIVYESLSIPFR